MSISSNSLMVNQVFCKNFKNLVFHFFLFNWWLIINCSISSSKLLKNWKRSINDVWKLFKINLLKSIEHSDQFLKFLKILKIWWPLFSSFLTLKHDSWKLILIFFFDNLFMVKSELCSITFFTLILCLKANIFLFKIDTILSVFELWTSV